MRFRPTELERRYYLIIILLLISYNTTLLGHPIGGESRNYERAETAVAHNRELYPGERSAPAIIAVAIPGGRRGVVRETSGQQTD